MDINTFNKASILIGRIKHLDYAITKMIEHRSKSTIPKKIIIEYTDYSENPLEIQGLDNSEMQTLVTQLQGELNIIETNLKENFKKL